MVSVTRVDVGGVRLSLRSWPAAAGAGADAPPVLLLPGTGMTARDWDNVAPALALSRAVHAVDLRGHGESDRPGHYSIALMATDVVGLVDRTEAPVVDLVGHSLGGLVACLVVRRRPHRVRRLVLEDVGLPRPRPAVAPSRPEGDLPFDWTVVEQVRPEIDDPDPGWTDVARAIPVPTLVVAGGERSTVPQNGIRALVEALPDGRAVTVDAGHLVHATEPEAFLRHVTAFLDA
jgi:pimeloyl-ACP methyl ester carboxylesterase